MPFAAIAQPEGDIEPLGEAACGWGNRKHTLSVIRPKRNIGASAASV
jgi:hypothetical protein